MVIDRHSKIWTLLFSNFFLRVTEILYTLQLLSGCKMVLASACQLWDKYPKDEYFLGGFSCR